MLTPKKEGLQAASLNDTICPYMSTMSFEWTLATLPVQSRVPSRKSHNLPKARTHEKISVHPCRDLHSGAWRCNWPSHLLAGACWHPPGSKHMGTSAHHCANQTTAMSMLLINPAADFNQRALKSWIWGLEWGGGGVTARQPFS